MAMKLIVFITVAFVAELTSAVTYDKLVLEANILNDTINNTAMRTLLEKYGSDHMVKCFGEQADNFEEFGKTMQEMLDQAAVDLENDIGSDAGDLLKQMGVLIKELPSKFWSLMKSGEYENALDERNEVGFQVRLKAEEWAKKLEKLQKTNSNAVEKAYEKVEKIHKEARRRSKAMSNPIGACGAKASNK